MQIACSSASPGLARVQQHVCSRVHARAPARHCTRMPASAHARRHSPARAAPASSATCRRPWLSDPAPRAPACTERARAGGRAGEPLGVVLRLARPTAGDSTRRRLPIQAAAAGARAGGARLSARIRTVSQQTARYSHSSTTARSRSIESGPSRLCSVRMRSWQRGDIGNWGPCDLRCRRRTLNSCAHSASRPMPMIAEVAVSFISSSCGGRWGATRMGGDGGGGCAQGRLLGSGAAPACPLQPSSSVRGMLWAEQRRQRRPLTAEPFERERQRH